MLTVGTHHRNNEPTTRGHKNCSGHLDAESRSGLSASDGLPAASHLALSPLIASTFVNFLEGGVIVIKRVNIQPGGGCT